jgi:SNF2 family DNA or RNA helicase
MLDPGLGKTSAALAVVDLRKQRGEVKRALVVAPLRVAKAVWPVEAEKWQDFRHLKVVHLCEMTDEQRTQQLKRSDVDVFVINPESLAKLLTAKAFALGRWDMLIVDESTKFKNSQAQRFKALKPLLSKFKYRIIMTGTPAPNGLADLFGQMYICDEGRSLGRYVTHFRQRYMHQDYTGFNWVLNPGAEDMIYDAVKPTLMRLMAKDHLDMPELIYNYVEVTLPENVLKQYKRLEIDFLVRLSEETIVAFNSAALGVKCRQLANGFMYSQEEEGKAHRIHAEKLDALEELIEEMQGRPLLVCYEFIEDGRAIMERFPQAVNISQARDTLSVVKRFNDGKIPVLIGHPASMGHGLNLQESCSTICWYGITWDLELYQQAIARVWRQGQSSDRVVVHHILARNTLDQVVVQRLASKDATQSRLNQALKTLADTRSRGVEYSP